MGSAVVSFAKAPSLAAQHFASMKLPGEADPSPASGLSGTTCPAKGQLPSDFAHLHALHLQPV